MLTVPEIAGMSGVDRRTVYARLVRYGWPVARCYPYPRSLWKTVMPLEHKNRKGSNLTLSEDRRHWEDVSEGDVIGRSHLLHFTRREQSIGCSLKRGAGGWRPTGGKYWLLGKPLSEQSTENAGLPRSIAMSN